MQTVRVTSWLAGMAGIFVLLLPAIAPAQEAGERSGEGGPRRYAETAYTEMCAGCHGADLAGGRAQSLFNRDLLAALSDQALLDFIMNGLPGTEMKSFREQLSDDQAWQIIAYLRRQAESLRPRAAFVRDPANQIVRTERQNFRIEVVANGLDTPWGLAFLPDRRLLITERSGNLRIVDRDGRLSAPVVGVPQPYVRQDAGLLDVAVHPDYARNGWIYLAYVELAPGVAMPPPAAPRAPGAGRPVGPPSMTVIVRGRLNARNEWVDMQPIYRAPAALYTSSVVHYGSRLLFDGKGHLFFTLGERGEMAEAQKLDSPLGKIHRVNDDGSSPRDNPFVGTPGAVPSIWSLGHRNPQGLAVDPVTGALWESEHGPTGGDEINLIEKGKNYGWGVISMGVQGGITKRSEPGMLQPVAYYTPAIGPSAILFSDSRRYPGWRNNLFVTGLVGQTLRRLEINGREVVAQEEVLQQFGRVRSIATGPDGLLYVLLQDPTGEGTNLGLSAATPGRLVRLVPLPAATEAPLKIVSIDVEGGAATLYVTPRGRSVLIDAGWPAGRGGVRAAPGAAPQAPAPTSAQRIVAAANAAGVKRLDYLIVTHYHVDHVGGVQELLAAMPVGTIIDHGPNREWPPVDLAPERLPSEPYALYPKYAAAVAGFKRVTMKTGETLDVDGLVFTALISDGVPISRPLAGGGTPGVGCDVAKSMVDNGGEENPRSLGLLVEWGKARILSLADLSREAEINLVCPINPIGRVDLMFADNHGSDVSNSPALLDSVRPNVVLFNNGARKGGDGAVLERFAALTGLQGMWQLHFATRSPDRNGPPDHIANLDGNDAMHAITITVDKSGNFALTNGRNGFSRRYLPAGE